MYRTQEGKEMSGKLPLNNCSLS